MLPMTSFTAHTTVRFATDDDRGELSRLAVLDSTVALAYPVLVGEAGGVLVAARSLADGRVAADPFKPTADVVELLKVRASHYEGARTPNRGWTARVRPSLVRA
jgi:hypothetical protein